LLWNARLNGDISGAPITYTIDGKQYVAIGAGGRVGPTTSLGRLVDIDVPEGSGVMWVFALPDDEPLIVGRPARAEAPTRSLLSGVYTAEQAADGEQAFNAQCSSCHEAENYSGANLVNRWAGGTLSDIYQDFARTMPLANPGALSPQEYASILAYFVSQSGFPAGSTALPGDVRLLGGMAIGELPAP
jgi:cytochrome c553